MIASSDVADSTSPNEPRTVGRSIDRGSVVARPVHHALVFGRFRGRIDIAAAESVFLGVDAVLDEPARRVPMIHQRGRSRRQIRLDST